MDDDLAADRVAEVLSIRGKSIAGLALAIALEFIACLATHRITLTTISTSPNAIAATKAPHRPAAQQDAQKGGFSSRPRTNWHFGFLQRNGSRQSLEGIVDRLLG